MTLIQTLIQKATLKQEVYHKTLEVFGLFRQVTTDFVVRNRRRVAKAQYQIRFEFKERGDFQFELRFGSDILIFMMHTNIFELPRDHEIMKCTYIHEDKSRTYCGNIMIFNFLADSFEYNRSNDLGYCIARIFINRDLHYFIEGKREIGLLYNNFPTSILSKKEIASIVDSAILYTLNFDLLTPPFDQMKEVTVQEMKTQLDTMSIRTGKRIGYRFQADEP
jgi:hypothetical protein